MNWNLAIEEDRQALKRIVALCLSLATLAERVSNRAHAVRSFVLWILRRAEAVAWEHLADVIEEPLQADAEFSSLAIRGSSADAMHLAQRFRMIATALDWAIRASFCFARAGTAPAIDLRNRDRKHPILVTLERLAYRHPIMRGAMERCDSS